jgi:hypothetical protein
VRNVELGDLRRARGPYERRALRRLLRSACNTSGFFTTLKPCAWLTLASNFKSPSEFLLGTMTVATPAGGSSIERPIVVTWGGPGLMESDGLG